MSRENPGRILKDSLKEKARKPRFTSMKMVIKGDVNESVDETAALLYIGFKGDGVHYLGG